MISSLNRITWIQPYYDIILNLVPLEAKTILDIGAGSGVFGFILKKTRVATVTAIEPFGYDLPHYDKVIAKTWQDSMINEKYDCIVSTEMIEHLEKSDALAFLRWARTRAKKVIIATPYHFEAQPAYDGNEHQLHRCVVTIEDFEKAGYSVRLMGTLTIKGLNLRFSAHKAFRRLLESRITNLIATHEV